MQYLCEVSNIPSSLQGQEHIEQMEKEGKIATHGQKGGQRQKAKSPQEPHSQRGMLTPGNVKVKTPLGLLFASSFFKRPMCNEKCRQTPKWEKKRVWTRSS